MATHIMPPAQCIVNVPSWTDPVLTGGSTSIRKVHIDELRSALNSEFTRRVKATASFTDPTITAKVTTIRSLHIDELRTECGLCKSGRGEAGYCPGDTSGCMDFTDPTLTPTTTQIETYHITELRQKIESLMTSCICEVEQCQYCADCGYTYSGCSHAACACDDSQPSECSSHSPYTVRLCASINLPTATSHPYKASDGTTHTAWDGYVPWAMCGYTPPGSAWGTCEYATGHNHSAWNCKCNPYTW